jgi:hypothetical protein
MAHDGGSLRIVRYVVQTSLESFKGYPQLTSRTRVRPALAVLVASNTEETLRTSRIEGNP